MANLRDLAPGVGTTLNSLAPGVVSPPTADTLRVVPATDPAPAMREMERDSSSQTALGYKSSRILSDANYLANEEAVRRAAGDVAGADTLRGQITNLQQEAAFWAPKEQDITKIGLTEPGRLLDYGAGAVGSIAASFQDPALIGAGLRAATGLAGLSKNPLAQAVNRSGNAITAGGVFAPNFMANAGETYNEQAADAELVASRTPMERALAAGGAGLAMGALDSLPQMGVLGRALGPGNAVTKAIGPGGILAKAGRDSVLEGATEVAQTGLQKGVHTLMNENRDTSGDFADYANALAQGTLGSAPVNVAANTMEAMRGRVNEPGDPGVKKGDDVDLKTGKVVGSSVGGEGVSLKGVPDFEADLKQRSAPEWATSEAAITDRMRMMDGLPPDGTDLGDEAVSAKFAYDRRDAILGELTKAGDEKSKAYAEQLAGFNLDDPFDVLDAEEVMSEAFDHVRPMAGLDDDSIGRLIAAANKRKKSERLFAPQDHIELKGEAATMAKNVSGWMASMLPEEAKAKPGVDKFLTSIGRELASMGAIEVDTKDKDGKVTQAKREPSEGELQRAARLGTIAGSVLRGNTETALKQLPQVASIEGGKLLQTFTEHATLHSGKMTADVRLKTQAHRADTADRIINLIPESKVGAMQKAGINLYDDNVKAHLVDALQSMFDGDESKITPEKAATLFGKQTVAKMEKLLGMRIGAEQMVASSATAASLDSDESMGEASAFEKAQAEKSAAKAPSDSIIYGRGSQGKGIQIADLLKGKGKENKLPSFIDTRHPLAQKERDKLMAEYEATAGTGPKMTARIAPVSELLGDMPREQREGLMLRAIEEDYKGKGGDALTADDRRREDPVYLAKAEASGTARGLRAMKDVDRVLGEMYANWRPRSVKAVNDTLQNNAERLPEAVYQAAVQAMQSPDRKSAVRVVHQQIRAAIEADTARMKQAVSTAAGTQWTEGGDPSRDYFMNKEVLVVEKADATADKDPDVMTRQEFKDLVAKGKKATDAARKLENEDAANAMLWKEGMLHFPATEDGGEGVSIKAKHIVAWVRNAEFSSTTMTDGAKRKAAAQNKQENFLSMLAQGMAEMLRQGYITGLPVVIDAQGNAEAFAQPRSRKEVNADRRAALDVDPDSARAINRKFDAELRLGGMPASLMLGDGRTAEQFVLSPKFSIAAETNDDPLLGSAFAAARSSDGEAERITKSIAAARQRATEREAALRDARKGESDKVSLEQAAADKFLSRNDEVAPVDGDGFYFGDPTMDGTEADVDAQETAARDNAIQNATTFANTKYGRNDAVTKAKQVGKELWQQWVMTPKDGLARIKAIAKDLTDKRSWHAAPLAALVAEARARSEKLDPSDKVMMQSLVSKAAGVVLRKMEPSADRTKIVADLAGTTFDDPGAENTWLAKAARHYAEVEAKRHEKAEAAKEAAKAEAAKPAPKATPGKAALPALKASINERKAQRLEAELASIDARLAELQKTTKPIAEARAALDAARDSALFAAGDRDADKVARADAAPGATTPVVGVRAGGRYRKGAKLAREKLEDIGPQQLKSKPLTPAQVKAGRDAARAEHRARVAEARAALTALVDKVGETELEGVKKELASLADRKVEITKALAKPEERNPTPTVAMGRTDGLGADGVPKIPGDKGAKTTPSQRKAERVAAGGEGELWWVISLAKSENTLQGKLHSLIRGNVGEWEHQSAKYSIEVDDLAGGRLVLLKNGTALHEGNALYALNKLGAPEAERLVAKAEPTTAAPAGQGFNIVQLPFGASKSGVFDGHRAGSKNVTNAAPGAPGALGNPFVASDVRGTTPRKEAVAKFKEAFLKRVNSDSEYRDWVLTLRGKAVGYYKPDEADIHLHVVQEWLAQQSDAPAPDRKMVSRKPKEGGVQVRESTASGYATRTKHNADAAGATVAIAADHNTAGEKLTQRVAGSKLFKINIEGDLTDAGVKLAEHMKKLGTTTLNVAGNGIYTLAKTGWDQQAVNEAVYGIIAAAHAIQPITLIVSGGQTGVDIAGAIAAKALGIPAEITLPAGYLQRGADGVDRPHTRAEIGKQIVDGAAELMAGVKTGGAAQKLSNRDFEAQKARKGGDAPTPSDADLDAVRAVIGKLLGPQIKVAFEKAFDAAGEWVEADKTVRIALGGVAPMLSTAYHEGLHGFFSQVLSKNDATKEMLYRAVNDPKVDRQLRALLAGETAALAALDASPEEKVAYTFELWATGLLDLPAPDAKGFFGKVRRFFRSVLGLVNDQDRALEIFTALHDGKMAEPSAAQRAVQKAMERGEGMAATRMKRDREVEAFRSMVFSAGKMLRSSESETANTIGRMFFTNPGSTKGGTEPGYLNLRRNKTNQSMNHLRQVLDGLSPAELKHLAKLDNDKTDPETLPDGPVKTALKNLYKFNGRFYTYLTQAGLNVGVRDNGRYTPMVWNLQYMIENKDKFVSMLVKEYPEVLTAARAKALIANPEATTLEDVAGMMHQAIVDRNGVDAKLDAQREDGVLSPFFASENGRTFDWIAPQHRAEFLSEDIVEKMTSYIHQGVRAAEYTRAFGEAGEDLAVMLRRKGDTIGMTAQGPVTADEDGPVMTELREAAAKAKVPADKIEDWVQRRHEDTRRAVGAMEGVLGKDITDRMRRFNSGAMVYQNLRLLPLSIFAAMLDPNGIMVSGGTLNDGLKAYVRGMKKVFNTWKALATGGDIGLDGDEDERAAIIIGSVDSTVFLERMGEARTSEYIGGTARKVNNKFFLANGLTMWDRSMRIAATAAGMRFIKRHAEGENPEHSTRWLKDLGLTADDVTLGADGKVVIDRNQLARMRAEKVAGWGGMTDAQKADQIANLLPKATKDVAKMHAAVNRFVERSILSPNAAQRPTWASDPHFAALFHLKQYTYSFHETIMQHVAEEAGHGNYRAGLQMLMGVPIMIAADITKGLVTGGGSLPGYMANWNMGDWLMHGWTRAGLNGIGQIGADAWGDPSSLLGPTVDQGVDTLFNPAEKFGNLDMVPGVRYLRPNLQDAFDHPDPA